MSSTLRTAAMLGLLCLGAAQRCTDMKLSTAAQNAAGGTCADYGTSKWCTKAGATGDGWDADWGDAISAVVKKSCCACGGGRKMIRPRPRGGLIKPNNTHTGPVNKGSQCKCTGATKSGNNGEKTCTSNCPSGTVCWQKSMSSMISFGGRRQLKYGLSKGVSFTCTAFLSASQACSRGKTEFDTGVYKKMLCPTGTTCSRKGKPAGVGISMGGGLVGGDAVGAGTADATGTVKCCASCGYTWCKAIKDPSKACVRSWDASTFPDGVSAEDCGFGQSGTAANGRRLQSWGMAQAPSTYCSAGGKQAPPAACDPETGPRGRNCPMARCMAPPAGCKYQTKYKVGGMGGTTCCPMMCYAVNTVTGDACAAPSGN